MNRIGRWLVVFLLLATGAAPAAAEDPRKLDTAMIERLAGAKGVWNEREGVFKVSVPRDDLQVAAAGVRITPPLGLTSWAAYTAAEDGAMVMGDMVITQGQVGAVMDAALAGGLEVTALHNHFLWDTPKIMFMHVAGHGKLEGLASGVGKVLARIRETALDKSSPAPVDIDPARSSLDVSKLESILGHKGETSKGVFKVTIGRECEMHGKTIGAAMGVNTWAAFAGADAQAAIAGDFAVREDELQPVLRTLRAADILVVAIHNHMIGESPRIVFLHYWGIGPAARLARGVRSALEKTKG